MAAFVILTGRRPPFAISGLKAFVCLLLCLAFGLIEALIGGTRLLFSLPAYGILGASALFSIVTWRRRGVQYGPENLCLFSTLR